MKLFVLFALLGVALALPAQEQELDWSKITSKNVYVEPTHEGLGPRVIGGTEATPNSRPYQAGIVIDGSGFCGGSLISVNYVLTAGHCTYGARSIEVRLGAHYIQQTESNQVRLTSTSIVTNSGYSSSTLQNDIGLIQLPSSVTLNSYIQVANLAPASAGTYAGSAAVLSGWGLTSNTGSISSVLMRVDLSVITNSVCANSFGSYIVSSMICTSGSGPVGGCNGDSGGPLTVDDVQVGIVSFGSSSCTAGYPTVFSRVSSFRSWIAANSDVSA